MADQRLSLGDLKTLFETMVSQKSDALMAEFASEMDRRLDAVRSSSSATDSGSGVADLQRQVDELRAELEESKLQSHLAYSQFDVVERQIAQLRTDVARVNKTIGKIKAELSMDKLSACPDCGSAIKYYTVDVGEFGKCDVCGWDHILEIDD